LGQVLASSAIEAINKAISLKLTTVKDLGIPQEYEINDENNKPISRLCGVLGGVEVSNSRVDWDYTAN
jgi:hypothetical protein